jgi:hypothetical protein
MTELPDAFGPAEILEPMHAQHAKRNADWQTLGDEIVGRIGNQGLSTVGDRTQSGAADDRATVIVPASLQLRLAGVERQPDLQGRWRWPTLFFDSLRISKAASTASEAAAKTPTTLSPSPCSSGRKPRCCAMTEWSNLIVACDGDAGQILAGLPKPSGPLDVAHQESDGARRKQPDVGRRSVRPLDRREGSP